MNYRSILSGLLRREWLLVVRRKGEYLQVWLFFVLVGSLFSLVFGASTALLATLAPGIIWVAALLASLLCSETLFKTEQTEGTLEQLLILGEPLYLVVLVKVLAHWLVSGAPLLLLGQLLALMLHLPEQALMPLFITLLLGTPVLSLIGAIGSALVVGVNRSGILVTLLVLPLYVPVLLLSVQTIQSAVAGQVMMGGFFALGACLTLALTLGPFAIAGGLKAVHFS